MNIRDTANEAPALTVPASSNMHQENQSDLPYQNGPERMADPVHFGNEGRNQNDFSLDQEERNLDSADHRLEHSTGSPVIEKDFIVAWDGEDDPMNPRSMKKSRKWVIVVIICTSSFCV